MKRIITCSDGTWNKINPDTSTNVIKIYNSICKEETDKFGTKIQQVKTYDEGVGTGYTLKDKLFGGATGSGIDKNIKDLYVFIMLNYEPGDQLFLFGFSRGAYTARSLAGLIRNSGILKPQHIQLVDKAYDLYRDKNDYSAPDSDLMTAFRNCYAIEDNTPIHFIGVWDTVGSLGIPLPWYRLNNFQKYKFHDVKLSSYVKYAYHALAIDENRKLFEPTLWIQSDTTINNPDNNQVLEQRWFAGCHSNVGGGYQDSFLSNIALQWMIDKASGANLFFNELPLISKSEKDKGRVINPYTVPYWFWLPKPRKILRRRHSNAVIDKSVWERFRLQEHYKPTVLRMLYYYKRDTNESSLPIHTLRNLIRGLPERLLLYLLFLVVFTILYFLK